MTQVESRLRKVRRNYEQLAMERREGGFVYRVIEVGAVLCGCENGSGSEIALPDKLGGLPVVRVEAPARFDVSDESIRLLIPASVAAVTADVCGLGLPFQEYRVADNNPWMCAKDGVLFSKDGAELVLYPQARGGGCYTAPGGVRSVRAGAFASCGGLTEVVLPESVVEVGSCAFYMCVHLERVRLPASVSKLGHSAFSYCSALREVWLPAGLETINSGSFVDCEGLREIRIPPSVTRIGCNAFIGCSALERMIFEGEIPGADELEAAGVPARVVCRASDLRSAGHE